MGLLRTSDQLIPQADPCTTKKDAEDTLFTQRDSNPRSQKEAAVDTGLRTQRHWDWQFI
jgi:hypothetical protein